MKRGTPKHPKVYKLASLLKCVRPTAVGYLEMLWHMTAEYCPQGDIGKYDDAWIEAALDWTGRKGHLINCLVEAGWLDREPASTKEPVGNGEATDGQRTGNGQAMNRQWPGNRKLFVHHWSDHAEDSVRKRLNRAGLQFLTVSGKVTGQSPVTDRKVSGNPVGLPSQAMPSHATPEPSPPNPPVPSEASELCASGDARGEKSLAKTPRPSDDREGWFDAWWQIYPRKDAKLAAQKAFMKTVKSKELFEQIMRALEAQLPKLMRDLTFCPYGAKWLNGAQWNDPVGAPGLPGKPVVREDRSLEASVMRVIGPRIAKGEKPW